MNFQQLRILREAAQRNFNLTEVANALFTSQSGVSKHILDLEQELGVELFVRRGKRLTGVTEPGKEVLAVAERMLIDAKNIKRLAEQFVHRDEGSLTVATTHTQARYALPQVVRRFKAAFPKVHLLLLQGSPAEIGELLLAGEADIGIATEPLDGGTPSESATGRSRADATPSGVLPRNGRGGGHPAFANFPFYDWHHAVVVPDGHALTQAQPLTLEALAEHPLITYHEGFTGRGRIDATFAAAGLVPDVVMSALDADVIKTYVEVGLGVGIVASMAFDAARDLGLRRLDADHLFEHNTTRITIRRGHYLRGYAYRFLEECSPTLTAVVVKAAVEAE